MIQWFVILVRLLLMKARTGVKMISALFDQSNYVATKRLLDVSVARHEAIASNLANLETPNYKRLDLDPSFVDELRKAVASGTVSQFPSSKPQLTVDDQALAQNKDGNTVQLEDELVRMGQNFVEHSLETQLVSGSLMRMRLAITGRA